MRWIADILYALAGLAYLPVLLYQAIFLGKNRTGWSQRFGFIRSFDKDRPRIWIHAVSLGEINATPRLVEYLQERLPDVEVVVSTTTDTGYARAVQLFGPDRVFRFPLDFSLVVSRVLNRIRPSLIVLVELEVWYNLVRMASRRGIPIAVVNGRLTERSAGRLDRLGSITREMFGHLCWVGAQDEAIATRFRQLGVPSDAVEVLSSMKWDSAGVCDEVEGADSLASALGISSDRPVWVCGSTGPGEETLILKAYDRLLDIWMDSARRVQSVPTGSAEECSPILVIVPRKPERFGEVARLIDQAKFECIRRSECVAGAVRAIGRRTIILGDTMGELRKFYSLADVVFVGRSLVPMGGSDPMEVAALGKLILVGPHMDNFKMPIEALQARDAVQVVYGIEELATGVDSLLRDGTTSEVGRRAREVVLANQGATKRTVDALEKLFNLNQGARDSQS